MLVRYHTELFTLSCNEVQWSVESPLPVHILPKNIEETHDITVILATLADYIIEHQ